MNARPRLAIWDDDGPTVSRARLLELTQRYLLPFLSEPDVEARLSVAESEGLDGCVPTEDARYEPVQALHGLFHGCPAFFEDREARLLPAEQVFLDPERERAGAGSCLRSYTLNQDVTVRLSELPEVGALNLWIPAPRHIPGVQEVELVRCDPPELRHYYLPEGGQIYDVPLLLHPLTGEVPRLRLEFRVTQCADRHTSPADPDLVALNTDASGGVSVVTEWLDRLGGSPGRTADTCVQDVVTGMEKSFAFTVWGPMSPKLLVTLGVGNIETLTSFLSLALRRLGFATRTGAAQPLMMEGERTQLRYPASVAYEHRFLQWLYPPTGERGVVDLTYWQRWSFAATARNTRSEAFRHRLAVVGGWGAARLRRGLYPGDLILAGVVPSSRFVNLNSFDIDPVPFPVDTELSAFRER